MVYNQSYIKTFAPQDIATVISDHEYAFNDFLTVNPQYAPRVNQMIRQESEVYAFINESDQYVPAPWHTDANSCNLVIQMHGDKTIEMLDTKIKYREHKKFRQDYIERKKQSCSLKKCILTPGSHVIIPPHVPHRALAGPWSRSLSLGGFVFRG